MSVILAPLDYVVSAFLLAWHEIFGLLMPEDEGWAWALAIVGMTVTIRVLLMPVNVRQARVRREMRKLEPEIRALQDTYGHDPELLLQERMKLVKATGMKPFFSFLPLVLMGLVLVGLFRIIDAAASSAPTDGSLRRGFMTETEALSLAPAEMAGARIVDTFLDSSQSATGLLAVALILVMCVTHVVAQRQEVAQAPPTRPSGPVEQKRPVLLYAVLVGLAAVGVVLPLGVLIFWATSKVWTVGEQRLLRNAPGWTS